MLYFKAIPNSIDFYKGIFLHVIPVRIIVPCCFCPFSYVNTNNYVLYIPLSRNKDYICLNKVIHQIDRNKRIAFAASLKAKIELVFVTTQENAFSQRFHFKASR